MGWIEAITAVTREAILFAAVGLFVGGVDELIVDLLYLRHRRRRRSLPILADLPPPTRRYALFVAAWDEGNVIGRMLATATTRLTHADLTIFVGTYPNDPATAAAVAEVAARDPRVRLVIGPKPGPTTKADCLNILWRAMLADEAHGPRHDAVLIHDAEDVVHRGELHVIDRALGTHDAVQLPVHPLPRAGAHLVGGTYLDEFAEAHGKTLVVRAAIGAGVPLAGVGCAIARPMLERIAAERGRAPFDPDSLTEDYELGLAVAALGGRTTIAQVLEARGGHRVSVRAYFPATLGTAVRQKTRWLIGIALAGWDRLGWRGSRSLGDAWMRMRDRRGPLAMLVLLAGYLAVAMWAALYLLGGPPVALPGWAETILVANGALFFWRMGWRFAFVARGYGTAEGLRAIPRMVVGNIVAMMAARRALVRYVAMLRGAPTRWDKTEHQFPDAVAEG